MAAQPTPPQLSFNEAAAEEPRKFPRDEVDRLIDSGASMRPRPKSRGNLAAVRARDAVGPLQ